MGKPESGMSLTKIKQLIFLQVIFALFLAGISCNKQTSDNEEDIVVTSSIVAVKQFYLQANDSVMRNLDSVFFSIDLNTGVIFNADSLPKGTQVNRLIPSITFANTMTKADITYTKDNDLDTTINYLENPEDSIDFTHPVRLDVKAADGVSEFSYLIKVNVHNQTPDSLVWDRLSSSTLPAMFSGPVAQKTIKRTSGIYSLIEEYNGEYTLSYSTDINEGIWQKNNIIFGFTPVVETFTSTEDCFWILSKEGMLYSSNDGENWTDTGEKWINILGAYGNNILGICEKEDYFYHTIYPYKEGFIETPMSSDFPVSGFSHMGIIESEWADSDYALIAGGVTLEGDLSSKVWAFDGNTWAIINDSDIPALETPMMARYIVFRDTPYLFTKRALDVWLLFGGVDENNNMNRIVYLSYDNGVTWQKASDLMQLPRPVPSLKSADVIVEGYDMSADLSDAWKQEENTKTPLFTRAAYTIDGYEITWICPYMYIFGGYIDNNSLSTNIWRGVISRLTFIPSI